MTHANAAMPDAATARSSGGWEEFRAPGPWNAPAAYWFWHHIPTRSYIVAQIQAMRDAGYQSFQIQTRLSFPRNRYLSDDYLAMCRLAADEAASRGMMIGIYDEYNWLSGHAGGLTVQGRDELRERHLFHVTVPVGVSAVSPAPSPAYGRRTSDTCRNPDASGCTTAGNRSGTNGRWSAPSA